MRKLFYSKFLATLLLAAPFWVMAQETPVIVDNRLVEAARVGDMEGIEAAIQSGVSINHVGINGRNALHVAAEFGRATAVQTLLVQGAKPDLRSRDKHTALSLAIQHNHSEVVAVLLAANADPNRIGYAGEVPLITAARRGQYQIVKSLLKAGADRMETDTTGRSAEDWAHEMRHHKVLAAFNESR